MKKWPVASEALKRAQALHHQGKLAEARRLYFELLAEAPHSAQILLSIAILEHQCGRDEQAIKIIETALLEEPSNAILHIQLGDLLAHAKRNSEAQACYERAAALEPVDAAPWLKMGRLHEACGRPEPACKAYIRALDLQPGDDQLVCKLGGLIETMQGPRRELEFLRQALNQHSASPDILNRIGALHLQLCELDQAIAHLMRALAAKPDFAAAYNNLGAALMLEQRRDEAIEAFQSALRIDPGLAPAHRQLALALLGMGEYATGWAELEWRWKCPGYADPCRRYPQPAWDGSDPAGKTILVHAEQGLGDTLQFLRYARGLHQRGAKVVFQGPPELLPLLNEQPYVERAVEENSEPGPFDCSSSVMSLPQLSGLHHPMSCGPLPYITGKTGVTTAITGTGPKVGLCWRGTQHSPIEARPQTRRSIPWPAWKELLSIKGISFHSLQKDGSAEVAQDHRICDLGPHMKDFAATAAILEQMDLVITIDTALAHLAGAMGRPAWTILPPVSDWRWGWDGESTEWYPNMRLFRQLEPGGWDECLARVADCLRRLAAKA